MLLQHLLHAVVGVALLRGASATPARVCVSKASTVPFARRGQAPGEADLGGICSDYRSETCCDRAQTDDIRRKLYALTKTTGGDNGASDACVSAWLQTTCSVCAPEAGVAPDGLTPVCGSVCDKLHAACSDEFFALDGNTQVLTPCRERDVVCTRLRDWAADGAETCTLAGFAPKADNSAGWCFDGRVPKPRRRSRDTAASGGSAVFSAEGLRSAWVVSAGSACLYALLRLRRAMQRSRSRAASNTSARENALRAAQLRAASQGSS